MTTWLCSWEEWKKFVPLIAKAEQRIWRIAEGGDDPGHSRPEPEVLHGDPTADVAAELASFGTSDDLQVNLFASEREGLTSPLAIRWDPAGRMVGDFKGNQVKRFSVEADGAGFSLFWKEPILHSRRRNFRPVDVKVGPDGAIYVVDWYNPITCHQDDAYRDPTATKPTGGSGGCRPRRQRSSPLISRRLRLTRC